MAQTEDTELRDLVIEALEKNGSLAKIRALLRANVFLVFEDEGQNLKQNVSLDNILKLPEGALCLSIIHEFLEFCNLKNTLFVYMAESRQGTDYDYEGKENLASKLKLPSRDNSQEPLLMTLLKLTRQFSQRKYFDQGDGANLKTEGQSKNNFRDDQNCTYIVHEDPNSSGTCNSQSDNSSDEKNKLHLRLQLDNSDTDTSSDSTRDKSSSEYIANEHIITESIEEKGNKTKSASSAKHEKQPKIFGDSITNRSYLNELKLINTNSSSDSTSYIDLKPYNPLDQKRLNTTGIPILEDDEKSVHCASNSEHVSHELPHENTPQSSAATIDSVTEILSSTSLKNEKIESKPKHLNLPLEESLRLSSGKSDAETVEYSNDFTSSSIIKNTSDNLLHSPVPGDEEDRNKIAKNTSLESPRQSSQSSISISDIADLISEKSSSFGHHNDNNFTGHKLYDKSKEASKFDKSKSDDSAEFSESSIPSLSNLSLDVHSD